MRIGIDCRKFYDVHANNGVGVERFVYHLVRTMIALDQKNDYVLFFYSDISPETIHKVRAHNPRVKIVKLFKTGSRIPLLDNHLRFSQLLNKEDLDIIIFPANVIPLFYRGKSILVIHDLAIYLHPEWFPEKQWFAIKFLVPRSLKQATKIVAISESTKNDLNKLFGVPTANVEVIYPGIIVKEKYIDEEVDKVRKKFDIIGDYFLFLGTIEPRKNILKLIQSFSNYLFENENSKLTLVLAGVRGWKFQPIFQFLNDSNKRLASAQIKYVGKVSNRERNILLKNCRAFVFPSRYEGFGFPVLEAMALGVPVLTGNNSSLVEIVGDAGLLVDAEDISELRRGMTRLAQDKILRAELVNKGFERVKLFTWEKTAKRFLDILK